MSVCVIACQRVDTGLASPAGAVTIASPATRAYGSKCSTYELATFILDVAWRLQNHKAYEELVYTESLCRS